MDSDKEKKPAEEFELETSTSTETPAEPALTPAEESVEKKEENPQPKEDNKKAEENTTPKDTPKNKEKKKEYSLEEIPEYVELNTKYSALQVDFDALAEEAKELREFKLGIEKQKKEDMINQFYMLSDEDKADVIKNIDTYSLDEIESKLSVICVRNRVDFSLEKKEEKEEPEQKLEYSLDTAPEDNIPDWIKAVKETEKNL